ncbi:MAG: UDP-N-acetylmuramate dehydrogenase [Micromonosporaceae bacterium]
MRDVSDETLGAYTTLRIGGPANRLVEVGDAAETVQAVRETDAAGFPLLVLAGGSNVVIADAGFPGTTVLLRSTGATVHRSGDAVELTVAAGHPWDDLVAQAVSEGWSGIECLSGIPGSTGATPIQNVGAYGQEVAETITAVRVYDRDTGAVEVWDPRQCRFGYRHSVFKHRDRWVVLDVSLRLGLGAQSGPIRYAELARTLGVSVGETAPMGEVRDAVLGLRRGKGMVLDAADPDTYSVGSFFVNPVLDGAAYGELLHRCAGLGAPPAWPGEDGQVKTSAAWLIERAGFAKGYHRDGVGISGKHTLALTNRGTGTAKALLELAAEIRDGVRDRFGVTLRPEPVLVGTIL